MSSNKDNSDFIVYSFLLDLGIVILIAVVVFGAVLIVKEFLLWRKEFTSIIMMQIFVIKFVIHYSLKLK